MSRYWVCLSALALGLGVGCTSSQATVATTSSGGSGTTSSRASTGTSSSGATAGSSSGSGASSTGSSGSVTSGGSSTGSGSSTSGGTGTGGVVDGDAGCSAVGIAPLEPCTRSTDCQCPARCVHDPVLAPYLFRNPRGECELPCVDGGCSDTFNVCRDGFCSPNICAVPGPTDIGAGPGAWQACDAAGSLDGTCVFVPGVLGTQNTLLSSFYCVQGGDSVGGCDPAATRASPPSDRCQAGRTCEARTDGGVCDFRCDQTIVPTTCPGGLECASGSSNVDDPFRRFGTCYPVGPGGCPLGLRASEGVPCTDAIDCGCPLQCVQNSQLGIKLCERPCQGTADCALDDDHCAASFCETNYCVADMLGNPLPGEFNGPCAVDDGGVGTCVPTAQLAVTPETPEFGLCLRAGTATATCVDPVLEHTPIVIVETGQPLLPADLCTEGNYCIADNCTPACDPFGDGGCPSGLVCLEQDGDPPTHRGACGACLTSGNFCTAPASCCSGVCTSNFTCQ